MEILQLNHASFWFFCKSTACISFLNLNKRIYNNNGTQLIIMVHNYFRDLKMEEYLKNGKEIYHMYCASTETRPIMLPKAPQQKYIDAYPDENEPDRSFKDDKKRQLDYGTEVVVYRALEGLIIDEDIIVLHSFDHTHRQYQLCDENHVRKGCMACRKTPNNREGECDFLIIGKNFFVIIEVKNMTSFSEAKQQDSGINVPNEQQHKLGLQGSFKKSVEQRKRMVKLIRSIEKCTNISHFTAYPNFPRKSRAEFNLKPDQISSIIFKEDIEDLASWWRGNVADFYMEEALNSDFRAKHEKVRNMLLAIWCTDNKGHCDKSKCSLGWCIQDIDEKLLSGNFTIRKDNPNVIPAPDVIRKYLGVNNLTEEQFEAFNSEEKLLLINGPAGTGKSVILIAKAIQVAKLDTNRKITFFASRATAEKAITPAFEKANVRHCTLSQDEITDVMTTMQIIKMISFKLINNEVVVIHCPESKMINDETGVLASYQGNLRFNVNPEILISHLDCDVFLDDIQNSQGHDHYHRNIIKTIFYFPGLVYQENRISGQRWTISRMLCVYQSHRLWNWKNTNQIPPFTQCIYQKI